MKPSPQFLRFLLTGGIAAATNFGSRIVFSAWVSYAWAVVLAYLVGMCCAFVLARAFVFMQGSQSLHRSALFFTLVNLFAVGQTWLISMALAYHLLPALGLQRHVFEVAHAVGIVVPVFSSYWGHRRWSFR